MTYRTSDKGKVKGFKEWLVSDETLSREDDYKSMLKQIDKYWDKLFADPIKTSTHDGLLTIQPQKTNNILERLLRDIKRGYRKKKEEHLHSASAKSNSLRYTINKESWQ